MSAGRSLIAHVLARAAAIQPQTVTVVVGHQAEDADRGVGRHVRTSLSWCRSHNWGRRMPCSPPSERSADKTGTLVLLVGRRAAADRATRWRPWSNGIVPAAPPPQWSPRSSTSRMATGESSGPARQMARIVEEKDATPAERTIREINPGIYAFALDGLFDAVRSIAAQNAQREYYLPDLVAIFRSADRASKR